MCKYLFEGERMKVCVAQAENDMTTATFSVRTLATKERFALLEEILERGRHGVHVERWLQSTTVMWLIE